MTLDRGLYCVFTPDAAVRQGGLPGVRISVAPARGPKVSIAGFNADGWIGEDEGVLVRVDQGPADVLVTIYQSSDATTEAPKLQVVRLSGEGTPAPAAEAAPTAAPRRAVQAPEGIEVMAHIYALGDVGVPLGDWIGEPGSQRWIEGFGIAPSATIPLEDIEYQAVLGRGWLSPWSEGGQFCGSRGMSLPILGLRVRLKGGSAATHRVALEARFVDGTRVGPVGDGDACEAPSLAALEAFHLTIEAIPGKAKAPAPRPAAKPAAKPMPKPVAKPGPKPTARSAPKPAPAAPAPRTPRRR